MKKFLLASLALLSLSVSAQSYMVMDNGMILTVDKAGFVYDIGQYAYPQKISLKGGQWFVEENGVIATVDEAGMFFRKYEVIPSAIKGKGINYFVSEEGSLFTIDSKGIVKIVENEIFKTAANFGGNFFTVLVDEEKKEFDLYVIDKNGAVTKAEGENLKVKDIVAFGGNYFMTNRGIVYTVSSEGKVIPNYEIRAGIMMKKGGNFFTDSSGLIFTIAQDGTLKMPALPMNLRISTINKMGANYFIDQTGRMFAVDQDGNVFERIMRDHDFRNARVISN